MIVRDGIIWICKVTIPRFISFSLVSSHLPSPIVNPSPFLRPPPGIPAHAAKDFLAFEKQADINVSPEFSCRFRMKNTEYLQQCFCREADTSNTTRVCNLEEYNNHILSYIKKQQLRWWKELRPSPLAANLMNVNDRALTR
ncbi:hypothetical protein OPV22_030221 [Ensete ventricosum]|uniref:Uncharacterized protein n=1 Tax=Ensete ventricosum TaxID=4639 RepID=A0AAV8Q867_ENSVE|nr:hypothetical protein OPV22_030221 [Ensete ventricosum]